MLVFLIGFAALIHPPILKLKSRLAAVAVFGAGLPTLGLATEIAPNADSDVSGVTLAMMVIYGLLVFLAWQVRRLIRQGRRSRLVEAMPEAVEIVRPKTPKPSVPAARDSRINPEFLSLDSVDVEDRLEEHFSRYRAGDVSLDGYREAIEEEEDRLRDALNALKDSGRRETDDGLDRSELRDAIDQCRWRREWIEKEAGKVLFDAPGRPNKPHGSWARFSYVDAHGEVTEREIRNWNLSARHIEGYCMARREGRSFRLDRIAGWAGWG